MTETITPDEVAIPMPTPSTNKKNIVIINGVIHNKDEIETQQKQQEEKREEIVQSNQIHFPWFKVSIYWIYLLIFIINILILQWSGIFTGCICCIFFGLFIS